MIDIAYLLPYMGIGLLAGMAYSGWTYLTKTNPGEFESKRFVASALFGMGIGVIGGYTVALTGTTIESAEWWVIMVYSVPVVSGGVTMG